MNKIYCAILFVIVTILAGCSSQPSELKPAIEEYFSSMDLNHEFTITSAQKATLPSTFTGTAEDIWCVTISPPALGYFSNFVVARVGLNWDAGDATKSYFLDMSCTNYQD